MVETLQTTIAPLSGGAAHAYPPTRGQSPEVSSAQNQSDARVGAVPVTSVSLRGAPISSVSQPDRPPVYFSSSTDGSGAGQARPPLTPLVADSGLTTYRDTESGRLIVRVFDRKSGDVLIEFPPEGRRSAPVLFTSVYDSASAGKS